MTDTLSSSTFEIYPLSEQAITLEFGHQIDINTAQKIQNFNQLLQEKPFPGFKTSVQGYTTLTVFFDLLTLRQSSLAGKTGFEKASAYLNELLSSVKPSASVSGTIRNLPVCYGGNLGPDIGLVAQANGLTIQEVIDLHRNAIYQVYMIGFVPGFAYLGGMDQRLATPRKENPRSAVPAGSVGIAGAQTGVYPLETPGGWQIIGQTPLHLFDATRGQPSFLSAGDQVIFRSIPVEEFHHLSSGQHAD